MPSRTSSCRWRISMRSVISGMLRRNSLVRIGRSDRRHRIVPFQRPSITASMASIGQGEHSFFETGTGLSLILTNLSVHPPESVYSRCESHTQELTRLIWLNVLAVVCIGLLAGVELAVSVFVNPVLWKLDPAAGAGTVRAFARNLGAVMPVW